VYRPVTLSVSKRYANVPVWRILNVIRSGAVTPRRCSSVANWTDSISERQTTRPVRTPRPRSRRRAAADAETMIGGRCFAASPAELRWLLHQLRTAGYSCSADQPPVRHQRLAGSSVGPRPGDKYPLRLLVSTLTNVEAARDERAVTENGGTNAEVQDPVHHPLSEDCTYECTLSRALPEKEWRKFRSMEFGIRARCSRVQTTTYHCRRSGTRANLPELHVLYWRTSLYYLYYLCCICTTLMRLKKIHCTVQSSVFERVLAGHSPRYRIQCPGTRRTQLA